MHRFHSDVLWGEYSEEDLKGYWRDAMAAMGGAPKPDSKDVQCSVVADPVTLKQLQNETWWNIMRQQTEQGGLGSWCVFFCSRSRYFHLREIPWNSVPLLEGTSFVVSLGVMCFCLRTTRKRNGIRCLAHVAFSKIQHSSFFLWKCLFCRHVQWTRVLAKHHQSLSSIGDSSTNVATQ